MLPLYDANRGKTLPAVTYGLILANSIVFLWEYLNGFDQRIFLNFGEVPILVLQGKRLFTLVTSMFIHGDFWHIFGNMMYLFVFGNNVEDRFGHVKYFILYIIFGIVGGFTNSVASVLFGGRDAFIPAIGASGAIAGVLGAYVVFFPGARIISLVLAGIAPVPAWLFIGFWFILQLLYSGFGTSVAYIAHIGGFIAGLVLALIFKERFRLETRTPPVPRHEDLNTVYCRYCGNRLPDEAIFCPICGGKKEA